MSGHSKWSTIKHKKAAKDAKRGKVFTKLIKEITVAARIGGGDINANPRLAHRGPRRRAPSSMPNDNIDRAIKKGTGELEGVNYEEVIYEGYGPGGVAVLVEVLTDNRNRTVAEVRNIFDKHGGNLGTSGCVAWMFTKRGLITVERARRRRGQGDRGRARGRRRRRDRRRATSSRCSTAPEQLRGGEGRARAGEDRRARRPRSTMMPSSTTVDQRQAGGADGEARSRRSRITTTCRRVSSNIDIAAEELERLSA